MTNSGALYVERYAELVNTGHDLLVALAGLYVMLQQAGADFASGARDLGHYGGLNFHHHLPQIQQLKSFVHESGQMSTRLDRFHVPQHPRVI